MKKSLMIVVFSFCLVAPALAQGGPEGPPPEAVLADVLELDQFQLESFVALVENLSASAEQIHHQAIEVETALGEELEKEAPDPTAVGELVLQILGLHREFDREHEEFRQSFLELLTEEQRFRIEEIHATERTIRGIEALHRFGL